MSNFSCQTKKQLDQAAMLAKKAELELKEKAAAKEHLLRIQLLLAKKPIRAA